jgi:hypothetical protein
LAAGIEYNIKEKCDGNDKLLIALKTLKDAASG